MNKLQESLIKLCCFICKNYGGRIGVEHSIPVEPEPIPEPIPEPPEPLEWWESNQPETTEEITHTELWNFLHEKFPEAEIFMGENYRTLMSYNDLATFLAQDQTNKMEYIADKQGISSYDCNVFANRLMGQFSVPGWADKTFGKVWTSQPQAHALTCAIDVDWNFLWVEPQNDGIKESLHVTIEPIVRFIEM